MYFFVFFHFYVLFSAMFCFTEFIFCRPGCREISVKKFVDQGQDCEILVLCTCLWDQTNMLRALGEFVIAHCLLVSLGLLLLQLPKPASNHPGRKVTNGKTSTPRQVVEGAVNGGERCTKDQLLAVPCTATRQRMLRVNMMLCKSASQT